MTFSTAMQTVNDILNRHNATWQYKKELLAEKLVKAHQPRPQTTDIDDSDCFSV